MQPRLHRVREKRSDPRGQKFDSLCFSESENRAKPNRSRGANEPGQVILDGGPFFSMSFYKR